MNKSELVLFYINEGRVTGFDIHPSNDYLLVTSSTGKIYVFRLDTGEVRGSIDAPDHAQGCLIDPSGLYVVV
jgi:WD40 repeat protein